MNIDISACQASVHCNAHLTKTAFFRCGVMSIAKAQEIELKKTHEDPILIKMELS